MASNRFGQIDDAHQFLVAFAGCFSTFGPELLEEWNMAIMRANQRCTPEQPVAVDMLESLQTMDLIVARAVPSMLERFSDDELMVLAEWCGAIGGIFSTMQRLELANQVMQYESGRAGLFPDGNADMEGIRRKLARLNDFERYVLCDILRRLIGDPLRPVEDLRAELTTHADCLAGRYKKY